VKKRQRRLAGVDELVISLAAKGLTTGEIAAHFADVYGAEVSRDTISHPTRSAPVGHGSRLCAFVTQLGKVETWQPEP
jgi:hypothetical protein